MKERYIYTAGKEREREINTEYVIKTKEKIEETGRNRKRII